MHGGMGGKGPDGLRIMTHTATGTSSGIAALHNKVGHYIKHNRSNVSYTGSGQIQGGRVAMDWGECLHREPMTTPQGFWLL